MSRKILALCLALAAFAVAPGIASASPVLTYAAGGTVPTGSSISGASSNLQFVAGTTTVSCTDNTLGGTLLKNNGTEIEGTIGTATFTNSSGGACATNKSGTTVKVTPEELPWCLTSTGNDTATIIGGDCGTAERIHYIFDIFSFGFSVGSCTYESAQTGGGGVGATYEPNRSPLILMVESDTTFTRKSCTNSTVEAEFAATFLWMGWFTLTSEGSALEVS